MRMIERLAGKFGVEAKKPSIEDCSKIVIKMVADCNQILMEAGIDFLFEAEFDQDWNVTLFQNLSPEEKISRGSIIIQVRENKLAIMDAHNKPFAHKTCALTQKNIEKLVSDEFYELLDQVLLDGEREKICAVLTGTKKDAAPSLFQA